ncbi:MAG: GTPase Era [Chloroflexi bacterium]|nr:GTPase Era [Chloroflexota bacterium]
MTSESVFHSGYVTLIGRPNVGKSTLLNALLKQKVAAVSPRPQTTRKRQLGILTDDSTQIIFIDTPGIHKPHHKLGEFMNDAATDTLLDADLILWVVDASEAPHEEDFLIANRLTAIRADLPVVLVLNKVDTLNAEQIAERREKFAALYPNARPIEISALTGAGQSSLMDLLVSSLPAGPKYFPEDTVTDLYERDIAADLIREAALVHLRDEIPHAMAVRIDEYLERGETGAKISATLFVERDSQKGIVIGKGGSMLKEIGSTARKEIERMSGRKVFLDLRVKTSLNWRNDPHALRLFGFEIQNEE